MKLHTSLRVTTKYKYRAETKKKSTKKRKQLNIIKKMKMADGNTREKKQWRYKAIRKQKIKWHYCLIYQ